ncbi:FAD-dependent monooxygenase [Streptomyces sp. NPDC006527]|uniref:FAD-dependent monooxygenase n=1 Tax=Streptomyces sp. NPDC006527 TaxID=3364749 RepID=UPI003676943E
MSRTVVIAGGGPVGLMLASELSLAGVEAVVIERFPEPSDYSRSLTLHARTAEVLEQRGLNRFSEYPRVASYNFGLVELQDYIDDESLLPLLVPQRDIEALLEDRAVELGADVRRGQEVVGFEQDADGVTVTVRPADGSEYSLTCAYLVGCDGGSSTVRKLAGIDFPGTVSTADGLTADVITPLDVEEFIHPTICQPGMYASIPLRPGLHRVTAFEFGVPKTSKDIPPTVEEFQAKFRKCAGRDLGILATGEVRHLSRVGNATRLAAEYRKGRVFLAGDACHIHLPISGQGLNTGVQDALNLGWKLAAELNGWAPAGLLDTYHSERRPVGERLCWSTSAQDGLLYPLDQVAPLRELFTELVKMDVVNKYLMSILNGLGIKYAMTVPGGSSEDAAHPLIGGRVPVGKLTTADGDITISETLHAARGVLLLLGDQKPPEDLTAGWSDRVDVIRAEPAPEIGASTLLMRPDGYVAHAEENDTDRTALRQALRAWFGEPS